MHLYVTIREYEANTGKCPHVVSTRIHHRFRNVVDISLWCCTGVRQPSIFKDWKCIDVARQKTLCSSPFSNIPTTRRQLIPGCTTNQDPPDASQRWRPSATPESKVLDAYGNPCTKPCNSPTSVEILSQSLNLEGILEVHVCRAN